MGNKILIGGWDHPLIYCNQSNHFFTALEGWVGVVTLHQDTVMPCWSQERSRERCPAEFFQSHQVHRGHWGCCWKSSNLWRSAEGYKKNNSSKVDFAGFCSSIWFLVLSFQSSYAKDILIWLPSPRQRTTHSPNPGCPHIWRDFPMSPVASLFHGVSWMVLSRAWKNMNSLRVYSTFNNSHQVGKTLKIYPNLLGLKTLNSFFG